MEQFKKLQLLQKQYLEYCKQHIFLYQHKIDKENHPKYKLVNEILFLVSQGISIEIMAKEMNVSRKWLYNIGVRSALKAQGKHLLGEIVILHRAMQELKNVKKHNYKVAVSERKRIKELLYNKIAYINKFYYISLHEISTALGYRGDYINKSLASNGSTLNKMLKLYAAQTMVEQKGKEGQETQDVEPQTTNTPPDRLEASSNNESLVPSVA